MIKNITSVIITLHQNSSGIHPIKYYIQLLSPPLPIQSLSHLYPHHHSKSNNSYIHNNHKPNNQNQISPNIQSYKIIITHHTLYH